MAPLRTYLALCRASNLPTVWSNVLTALLLTAVPFSRWDLGALLMSLSLAYCGGMVFNDICDAAIDARQRPQRPIPSGMVGTAAAWRLAGALAVTSLALLPVLPHGIAAFSAGILLFLLIILYDLRHKDTPCSILLMAGCRLMIFVVAGVGTAGTVTGAVAAAGAIQFCYILLLSLAARRENRRGGTFPYPLIPFLLSGICMVDAITLSVAFRSPLWLAAGAGGMLMTLFAQKFVPGD